MAYMHFTTQQLEGGGFYSHKTKIGNWFEDRVMDETKFKDYIALKESNGLLVSKTESKYSGTLNKIPLTPFPQGYLSTGIYFMLKNLKTNGSMVIDTDDKNLNYTAAFAVTTSPVVNFPCARSLFKFEKYIDKKDINSSINRDFRYSPILTYGDKVCIIAYPAMYKDPLYLYSCQVSPFSFSRFSRNQEVLVNTEESYNNCWTLEHPDQTYRYSSVGKPIRSDLPFIIRHSATGACLSSDLVNYVNDYGNEYEMSCKNYLTGNKYQQVVAEAEGRLRIDTQLKTEELQNIWVAVDH